jgi:flagellar hook-length control protein FliK
MTVTAASTSATPSTTSAPASATATKSGTGKATGKNSAFVSMLQGADDTTTTATDDSAKQPDALQTMLAALNGGLSPLILAFPQQQVVAANTMEASGGTPAITSTNGVQAMQQILQNLQITNGDLATLLQKFGASPALMRVLLEQPQGQLAASLSAHPEVLADLEKALSNVAQQVIATPALLTDPKMTALMQSIMAQVSQQQQQGTDDQAQNSGQQQMPAMLGKLQATISTHAVEVAVSEPQQTASDSTTSQTGMTNNSIIMGAPLQVQLQPLNPTANAEPNVVLVQGDQLNNQLADLVVKRAALIEAPGRQEFRIVLQPQGLGEIQVRVEAVGNQISLHFTADNATSKGLLDAGLANLKNQLQSQGIQFNRIEVTTGHNTNQGSEFSSMPQERGSSQSFQGRQGNQSSTKRGEGTFAIDAIQENQSEEEHLDLDGIDVTA